MAMPSLLLVTLVLQVLIHLVNQFGAATINELVLILVSSTREAELLTYNQLWFLYSKLPTKTSSDVRSQTELRREVVRLKREMNATSSQDEFAKWAKLRRQHDKTLTEYEQKSI